MLRLWWCLDSSIVTYGTLPTRGFAAPEISTGSDLPNDRVTPR
jgi:hypothetical protein